METTRFQIKIVDCFNTSRQFIPKELSRCKTVKQFYERLELKLFLMELEEKYYS